MLFVGEVNRRQVISHRDVNRSPGLAGIVGRNHATSVANHHRALRVDEGDTGERKSAQTNFLLPGFSTIACQQYCSALAYGEAGPFVDERNRIKMVLRRPPFNAPAGSAVSCRNDATVTADGPATVRIVRSES